MLNGYHDDPYVYNSEHTYMLKTIKQVLKAHSH